MACEPVGRGCPWGRVAERGARVRVAKDAQVGIGYFGRALALNQCGIVRRSLERLPRPPVGRLLRGAKRVLDARRRRCLRQVHDGRELCLALFLCVVKAWREVALVVGHCARDKYAHGVGHVDKGAPLARIDKVGHHWLVGAHVVFEHVVDDDDCNGRDDKDDRDNADDHDGLRLIVLFEGALQLVLERV